MNVKRSSLLVTAAAVVLTIAGCTTAPEPVAPERPPVQMPPPVKEVRPEPVKPTPAPLFTPGAFADLPGWLDDDQREAWSAFTASCNVLGRRAQWAEACAIARGVDATDLAAVRSLRQHAGLDSPLP